MKVATSKGLSELINLRETGCVTRLNEYVEPIYDEPDVAQNGEAYMVPIGNRREPFYENSNFRNNPLGGHRPVNHLTEEPIYTIN